MVQEKGFVAKKKITRMKMKLLMHEINVIRQKFSFTIAYYCGILLAG
jgi:hypothetical protein